MMGDTISSGKFYFCGENCNDSSFSNLLLSPLLVSKMHERKGKDEVTLRVPSVPSYSVSHSLIVNWRGKKWPFGLVQLSSAQLSVQ